VAAELSEILDPEAPPASADIVALRGRSPWLRLRIGDYRILFRALEQGEADALGAESGYLIARIVHRRELERAVIGLR